MKKSALIFAALLLTAFLLPALTLAASLPLRVVVNGDKISFPDANPFVDDNDRIQVPIRFVSEALGAEVGWNKQTKTATVKIETKNISLTVGKKAYLLNGEPKQMDTAAMVKQTRMFVPIRFVTEGLGATVKWDDTVNTVYIDTTGIGQDDGKEPAGDKEVLYGFTVYHNTGSQLVVQDGHYGELGKSYALLDFGIMFDTVGADYDKQNKEVEEVLLQKVDKDTVDSVMKYVRTKTTSEPKLAMKEFSDDTYKIVVLSPANGGISITIYLK